jgi:hypothetical protein
MHQCRCQLWVAILYTLMACRKWNSTPKEAITHTDDGRKICKQETVALRNSTLHCSSVAPEHALLRAIDASFMSLCIFWMKSGGPLNTVPPIFTLEHLVKHLNTGRRVWKAMYSAPPCSRAWRNSQQSSKKSILVPEGAELDDSADLG